jgi:hypothetical protein
VDLAASRTTRRPPDDPSAAEDDVFDASLLADGTLALARAKPFGTTLVRPDGTKEKREGVLLETSPDGTTWLVAVDPARFHFGFRRPTEDPRLALELRDAASGRSLGAFELSGRGIEDSQADHRLLLQATFSPDGKHLVTVEGTGEIVVRDGRTGVPLQRIREYVDPPYPMGAAFHPDGTRLLTGGRRSRTGEERPSATILWRRSGA